MAGIEEHRSARDPAKVVSDYYFRLEHLLLVVHMHFILSLCVLLLLFFFIYFISYSVSAVPEKNELIKNGIR